MARVLDDAARGQLLNSLLDKNIGQPATRGLPITDDDVEEEDPRGAPPPMPGNQMSGGGEPMVQVPMSLANAGMQALMMQASGGRSLGADGAGEEAEPGDAEYDSDDKPPMKRRS